MATKADLLALPDALLATGMVKPVSSDGRAGKVSALCRPIEGQEKNWLQAIRLLLLSSEGKFKAHICRQYVLKEGQLVFGWYVSIDAGKAQKLPAALKEVALTLRDASSVAKEKFAPKQAAPKKSVGKISKEELTQRRIAYRSKTNALPRPPEYSGPDPVAPPNARKPEIRLVTRNTDRKTGQLVLEYEMPLPHVHEPDLNAPNRKGRGAWTDDFHITRS